MAGDPFRDAFRAEFQSILNSNPSITWTLRDTLNTRTIPDASVGFFELEFPGGSEEQTSFGVPGSNIFTEYGQVTLRAVTPRGQGTSKAEAFMEIVRPQFRGRRFPLGSQMIRVDAVQPMGGGFTEGGEWAEALAIGYTLQRIG